MEALLKGMIKLSETETASEEETIKFAENFASTVRPGTVIGLSGNLGAGKTHFIKGIAHDFGISGDEVVSPTFTIMREYYGTEITVYHFDFYRLSGSRELEAIGFRDYACDSEAVTCVEWPEIEPSVFGMYDIIVKISHLDQSRRKIEVFERK